MELYILADIHLTQKQKCIGSLKVRLSVFWRLTVLLSSYLKLLEGLTIRVEPKDSG